mgnify:CR=1
MEKIGKNAFVFKIGQLIILVLVLILLFFLIKNGWNVNEAFKDMLSLLRLQK